MAVDLQPAMCAKCWRQTLLGGVAGLPLALDVQPLTFHGYASRLMSGAPSWRVETAQNGLQEALTWSPGTPGPEWGPNGSPAGSWRLHGEHGCDHRHSRPVPAPGTGTATAPKAPASAPGPPPPAAPAGATAPCPAPSATPHRSDMAYRCNICRRLIGKGEAYSAIQHPTIRWAVHEECP